MRYLLFLWQLPQNLLGLILIGIYKLLTWKSCYKYTTYNGIDYWVTPLMRGGISLGKYVIFKRQYDETTDDFKHEYGHTLQSKDWGWLYLPVIGLLSLYGNIYDSVFHANWYWRDSYKWYYNQPWEKDADRRGGVER